MNPARSLRAQALACLSRREHSRAELERKLLAWLNRPQPGEDEGDQDDTESAEHDHGASATRSQAVTSLLDDFEARGLLSDHRYVDSLLHRRADAWGGQRLRQALRAVGIDEALSRPALDALRGSEEERARALWQRRFGQPPGDARERARQMRFLLNRGFGAEVIGRVLRAAG